MAPDAGLHPGQFAFASAEGDEGASSPPPSPTVRRGTLLFPDGPEDGRMFRFVLVDFFGDTEGAFDRIADPTTHR